MQKLREATSHPDLGEVTDLVLEELFDELEIISPVLEQCGAWMKHRPRLEEWILVAVSALESTLNDLGDIIHQVQGVQGQFPHWYAEIENENALDDIIEQLEVQASHQEGVVWQGMDHIPIRTSGHVGDVELYVGRLLEKNVA